MLVVIETSDILFAVDWIPAIFAVTDETFIVFTSNAFAILGLRALYFLLAGMMDRFAYLEAGVGRGAGVRRREDGAHGHLEGADLAEPAG